MVMEPLPPADVGEAPPFVASESMLPVGPMLPPPPPPAPDIPESPPLPTPPPPATTTSDHSRVMRLSS